MADGPHRLTSRRIPGAEPGVWQLAVAQTLIYAALYYIFPALLADWERETGWSKADLTLAFTLGLVAWAAAAPLAGRLIDRGHGAAAMGAGAFVGGLGLAALALAEGRTAFTLLWVLIGAALAFCTYDPCFSVITRTRGARARQAITLVTLVAGFAGTLSFPLAHLLSAAGGWRVTVAAAGAVTVLLAAPLAWDGARRLIGTAVPAETPRPGGPAATGRGFLARPAFWALCLAFSAIGMGHSLVISHLLPLLAERGFSAGDAVLAASMIGPMQVAGRLLMMAAERQRSNRVLATASFLALCLAALALLVSASVPPLLVLFVIAQGSGIGVMSIMKPMVTRDILGATGFGLVVGALALPALLASAAAPYAGSLLWGVGGYALVTEALLLLTLTGLAGFLLAARRTAE